MAYRIRKKNTPDNGPVSAAGTSGEPPLPPRVEAMAGKLTGAGSSRNAWGFAGTILFILLVGTGVVYHIHSKKVAKESDAAAVETKAEQLYSR